MIVRGIVSKKELERIKDAFVHHGSTLGHPGSYQTWLDGKAVWVEVDVNEDVFDYLSRTGYFDPVDPQPVTQVKCPNCGNSDINKVQLCIELPSYLYRNLGTDAGGEIYADDELADVVDGLDSTGSSLYCLNCSEHFNNPGIFIK